MTATPFTLLAVFLASCVEAVEAVTIVLAAGSIRSWRSAWIGVGAGLAALVVITSILGPAIVQLPIDALRVIVGGLLLTFGLGWLRKAMLRASGWKGLHDEEAIFEENCRNAVAAGETEHFDAYAFTLSFKGVLLEGLEVVFIVVTVGANQHRLLVSAITALVAVLLVSVVGVAVREPLARVPENAMKYGVAIILSSFGTFWATEGAGVHWPGSDAAIPVIGLVYLAISLVGVQIRRSRRTTLGSESVVTS